VAGDTALGFTAEDGQRAVSAAERIISNAQKLNAARAAAAGGEAAIGASGEVAAAGGEAAIGASSGEVVAASSAIAVEGAADGGIIAALVAAPEVAIPLIGVAGLATLVSALAIINNNQVVWKPNPAPTPDTPVTTSTNPNPATATTTPPPTPAPQTLPIPGGTVGAVGQPNGNNPGGTVAAGGQPVTNTVGGTVVAPGQPNTTPTPTPVVTATTTPTTTTPLTPSAPHLTPINDPEMPVPTIGAPLTTSADPGKSKIPVGAPVRTQGDDGSVPTVGGTVTTPVMDTSGSNLVVTEDQKKELLKAKTNQYEATRAVEEVKTLLDDKPSLSNQVKAGSEAEGTFRVQYSELKKKLDDTNTKFDGEQQDLKIALNDEDQELLDFAYIAFSETSKDFAKITPKAVQLKTDINTPTKPDEYAELRKIFLDPIQTRYIAASIYLKHVKGGDNESRKAHATGPDSAGQYFANFTDADINKLEKEALAKGEILTRGGRTYHIYYNFPYNIGYASPSGEETNRIRVEWSSGNVHSHPRPREK
jgi:hypothetical protein